MLVQLIRELHNIKRLRFLHGDVEKFEDEDWLTEDNNSVVDLRFLGLMVPNLPSLLSLTLST